MTKMLEDLAEVVRIRNGYLVGDAAYWIEKLKASDSFIERYHAEIAQNAEAAAKYRNDGTTHGEGCHTWGPKHYECLAEEYKRCFHAARWLAALEKAISEVDGLWFTNQKDLLICLKHRADEIMREWTEGVG